MRPYKQVGVRGSWVPDAGRDILVCRARFRDQIHMVSLSVSGSSRDLCSLERRRARAAGGERAPPWPGTRRRDRTPYWAGEHLVLVVCARWLCKRDAFCVVPWSGGIAEDEGDATA